MKRRILSIILVVSLLAGAFPLSAGAETGGAAEIDIATARNVATYHLATEPFLSEGDLVCLGDDFVLSEGKVLYNLDGEAAFYCFDYASTVNDSFRGYIVISRHSDLPYVMECTAGTSPFEGKNIKNSYYISPLSYFNETIDGVFTDASGAEVGVGVPSAAFETYEDYRKQLALENFNFIDGVENLNETLLSAINRLVMTSDFLGYFMRMLRDFLSYFAGSTQPDQTIEKWNAQVEQIIKTHAGSGFEIVESHVVDKNYMKAYDQSHWIDPGNPEGDCGFAAMMTVLAYYRDGEGLSNIPSDKLMVDEILKIYYSLNDYLDFQFTEGSILYDLGAFSSEELNGSMEAGLAYYLYSKGYKDIAQNVLDNLNFNPRTAAFLVEAGLLRLKNALAQWVDEMTGGELVFKTGGRVFDLSAKDVVVQSLSKEKPVYVGCLPLSKIQHYPTHFVDFVGYYITQQKVKLFGAFSWTIKKEYVEVYTTWGNYSEVIDWSVFQSTAIFSVGSLAELSKPEVN